jgi:hypothetical protein
LTVRAEYPHKSFGQRQRHDAVIPSRSRGIPLRNRGVCPRDPSTPRFASLRMTIKDK